MVPIFLFLGIPIALSINKLTSNIPNPFTKILLSQFLITLLAWLIMYVLAEKVMGGAAVSQQNLLQTILLSYFSCISTLIGIKLASGKN